MDWVNLNNQVSEVVKRHKASKIESRVEMHSTTAPGLISMGGVKITRNDKLPAGECHIVNAATGKLGVLLAVPMPPAAPAAAESADEV